MTRWTEADLSRLKAKRRLVPPSGIGGRKNSGKRGRGLKLKPLGDGGLAQAQEVASNPPEQASKAIVSLPCKPTGWFMVVRGTPESKANSRRLGRDRAGVSRLFKSAKARRYELDFAKQVPVQPPDKLLVGPVTVHIDIYYPDWRRDCDESLVLDLLQGRAYKNDRQVVEKVVRRFVDKVNPRATIKVQEVKHVQWEARNSSGTR